MQYFKHYTNAEFSEHLSKIEAKFGFEGLGRYWRFVEFLGRNFDGENVDFRIERSKLRQLFRFRSWIDLESFADHLAIIPGMELKRSGNVYEIKASILLELQSRDFKRARKERAPSAPKIKIKNKIKNIKEKEFFLDDSQIEKLYGQYPKKGAKKSGNEKLKRIIKTEDDLKKFQLALTNYLNLCKNENRELRFIKGWAVFVNQHEDFLDVEISEAPKDTAALVVENFISLLHKPAKTFEPEDWTFYNFWKKKFNCDQHAVNGGFVKPEFKRNEWLVIAKGEL